ncbi:L-threonylcarbamoyladenylate synthase [Spartinivicinus poritis]|uniref:L-threonylcarbamoyladenylate synthase n=1 Tax=Spartinivicinus poritis TaxID=2994640 RepID=A0ABT5U7G8_9GAMM|nr:L-threonylcarbamoyladenylate synthase [Spartinivicinus sp. A2-2]MDE1462310.1 L-threonylcarbamoyladenylate synthase [Spartinivicinus sp. A2-2]
MSQFFQIHPENPQQRLINQAADIISDGGVVIFPTDSAYAIGCHIGEKKAIDRIRRIRQIDSRHNFTLMCRDLAEISTYAKVDNSAYRLLKTYTPDAYTFILQATREVPRRFLHPKRRTIGLRVPDCRVTQALLETLGSPMMSVTMILPGDKEPMIDPYEMRQMLEQQVDLIIDGGYCGMEATTVISMLDDVPEILREGKGDPSPFKEPSAA